MKLARIFAVSVAIGLSAHYLLAAQAPTPAAAPQSSASPGFFIFSNSGSGVRLTITRKDAGITSFSVAPNTYFAIRSEAEPVKGESKWTFTAPTEIRLRLDTGGLTVSGKTADEFFRSAEVVMSVKGAEIAFDPTAGSK